MSHEKLGRVEGYDPSHPKWICNKPAFKWLWLFVYDFIFNITKRKTKEGQIHRKVEHPSWVGRQFDKIHNESVASLEKRHSQLTFDEPLTLPTIAHEDFDKDFFKYWKRKVNMPLVVRNYLSDAEIRQVTSMEELIKNNGNVQVKCAKNVTDEKGYGETIKLSSISLAEFLTSDAYKDYYINNFHGILEDEDFYSKAKGKEIEDLEGSKNFLAQWFISRKKLSGSSVHCAPADNMFLNIQGRKEWFFIDRTYTPLMQPAFSKYAVYSISELYENMEEEFYTSLIKNHPYFKYIPVYRCVLEEGDLLFNPPFWWHRVQNLTDFTVGCATRYWAAKETANSLAYTICSVYDAFRHPTKSVIPATLRSVYSKNGRGNFINSIFSKK